MSNQDPRQDPANPNDAVARYPQTVAPYPQHPYQNAYPGYPGAPDDDDGIDLKQLIAVLRRRRSMIATIVVIGTLIGGAVGLSRPERYTAEALLMIEPEQNQVMSFDSVVAGLSPEAATVETQVRLLTSSDFLRGAVDRLWSNQALAEAERDDPTLVEAAASWLPEDWLVATGVAQEEVLLSPEITAELAKDARAREIANGLSVSQAGRSYMISLRYTGESPGQAARVANTVAELYVEDRVERKLSGTRKAGDWLEGRLLELERELRESERAVEEYRAENGLIDSKGIGVASSQIIDLTNMLVQTRAMRAEKEARLRYVRSQQSDGEGLLSLSEVLESPLILTLLNQDSSLQRREAELSTDYGERHPIIQNIRADRQELQDRIQSEVQNVVANIENELQVLRQREISLESDMTTVLDDSDESSRAEIELRRLEREAEASRQVYESLLTRFKETREQQGIVEADARVAQRATAPTSPSGPPPLAFAAAGFVGSSMLALLLAFGRERLDDSVRSGKDIERRFGVPCLALVPSLRRKELKGGKKALKPHEYLLAKPLSTYAETVRQVFTALRLANIDNPPKVIQVTSSRPAEGKTTLAVSLATALAQHGSKTILVDCDMRHPSVKRELKAAENGGLMRYLTDRCSLDQAIVEDEAAGFDVLGVDETPPNPPRMLASDKMRGLMQELRSRYDHVVLDSTPVLGVTDSKAAMELADTVVFVVRWEETKHQEAEDAIKELQSMGAEVAGCVITQVDMDRHARYGYGGIDAYYSKYKKYYNN